ncbi:MAG: phenylalanine--tRNA ligase subunit beta, partial [Acutalibacteraceae bacterium]
CEGEKVGVFGKLSLEVTAELDIARDERQNQNIYLMELDYEALSAHFPEERRYHPLPATTPIKRDLALVCDEAITCGQLQDVIQHASPLVQDVQLFDIYRGKNLDEGKKSMAFTITLQNKEQEVAPADAERAIRKILGNLKAKLGVDMR